MQTIVVVGGGASGFFFAIELASLRKDLEIIILEKNHAVLQKVKVSGGGRCNVTHACFQQSTLLKKYPRGKSLLKKTLQQFSPKETMAWFAARKVTLVEEADGRMFPSSNSSQEVIDMMLRECARLNINIQTKQEVIGIKPKMDGFDVLLKTGKTIAANAVMMACGGFHKKEHYAFIEALGHTIETPLPSLFTFNIANKKLHELMGLSAIASVKISGTPYQEEGPVLITHWGLSGPAVLRLSAFAAVDLHQKNYQVQIQVNWLNQPEHLVREQWQSIRNTLGAQRMEHKNPFQLPQRLWHYVLDESGIQAQTKWSELNAKDQNKLIHTLCAQEFEVKGKTTFKEEFVTCGGVRLSEVNTKTMESLLLKNLFFGGEVLDVDGITGGFNFQHAWASGFAAARGMSDAL